ncbi:tRNA-splicing endonuclease subunit Sen54-like [Elysia marginata]|uniref:tRNA-splicing endonuclease subunit Sen54-like n=1 Tax=Elysia marginata TaxID=1093978 RepID=A0AAV4GHC1_9GAST|nr:tRNA-splicing endonuclease subunit Sen54-like [Elysia marginata]
MKKPPIKARNWAEYKKKSRAALAGSSARTPVDHLWQGDVTPLVKPEDAWSKQTILDRLDVIQLADNDTLLPNQDCMVDLKVSYCVHLPDSQFKKSMPGTPDHRVCVIRSKEIERPQMGHDREKEVDWWAIFVSIHDSRHCVQRMLACLGPLAWQGLVRLDTRQCRQVLIGAVH